MTINRGVRTKLAWSRDHHHLDPFLYFQLKVGHVGQQRRRLPLTFCHRPPSKLHRAKVRAVERTGLAGCVRRGGKIASPFGTKAHHSGCSINGDVVVDTHSGFNPMRAGKRG